MSLPHDDMGWSLVVAFPGHGAHILHLTKHQFNPYIFKSVEMARAQLTGSKVSLFGITRERVTIEASRVMIWTEITTEGKARSTAIQILERIVYGLIQQVVSIDVCPRKRY